MYVKKIEYSLPLYNCGMDKINPAFYLQNIFILQILYSVVV